MNGRPFTITVLFDGSAAELVREVVSDRVQVVQVEDLIAEAEQFRREWGHLGEHERERFWAKVLDNMQRYPCFSGD